VGGGTRIWHHAHIRAGARVGCDCVIGKGVFVDAGAVVGDRVKIENNVSVFSGVTLGDGVFVGPGATFTNDLYPRAIRPDGSPPGPGDWKPVATVVGEGASIGANATVLCGLEIGVWAMVGAGSVVVCDVLPHELVVGNPARHLGWVCACGRRVEGSGSVGADRVVCEVCG
jgi:UDP-2-acetamido-3-amino-2,3-dideoxy-glucuronate N-acetyltransferase